MRYNANRISKFLEANGADVAYIGSNDSIESLTDSTEVTIDEVVFKSTHPNYSDSFEVRKQWVIDRLPE